MEGREDAKAAPTASSKLCAERCEMRDLRSVRELRDTRVVVLAAVSLLNRLAPLSMTSAILPSPRKSERAEIGGPVDLEQGRKHVPADQT